MKWSSELKLEREQLEQRVKQLSNSITVRHTNSSATHWQEVIKYSDSLSSETKPPESQNNV